MKNFGSILPYSIDTNGSPTIESLTGTDRYFAAVISEFNVDLCAKLLAQMPCSEVIQLNFYEPDLSSFVRIHVPRTSIDYHLATDKWYSFLNIAFLNLMSTDFVFVNEDKSRGIFSGSKEFVGKCLALFSSDPVSEASEFFARYSYGSDESESGLLFVRTYTNI